jgi:hypothetical protein
MDWTNEMVLRVTDDEEAGIILNQRLPDGAVANSVDGDYDVVIEETPESLNLQSEEFEKILGMAKVGIQMPPDLIIEASSLRPKDKQRITDNMKAQAEMQAQMARMGQGQPQLKV